MWQVLVRALVASALWSSLVESAHRSKFRKCGDTRACRVQRREWGGEEHSDRHGIRWAVRDGSARAEGHSLRLTLEPSGLRESDVPCEGGVAVTVSVVGSAVRVHMVEEQPRKPRYLVQDVLVDGAREGRAAQVECDAEGCSLRWGAHWSVSTRHSPFRLRVQSHSSEVVSLNGADLLHFECVRSDAQKESDPPEWWSESFGGHTYSHRHGPSAIGVDVRFADCSAVYGIPEHTTALSLPDTRSGDPFRLFNLDVFEYELHLTDALYGAIPLMHAVLRSGEVASVLWLDASETWVDVAHWEGARSAHWMSESGHFELFVWLSDSPTGALRTYHSLTGAPQLPPLFALGHHQCRWNYVSKEDVWAVSASLAQWNVPTDVVWLDIEHTDGKRYLTWDADHFGRAHAEMIAPLWDRHRRRMVTIVDPHLKADAQYAVYAGVKSGGWLVTAADGSDFVGWCWPGDSAYPDFANPALRRHWASLFAYSAYAESGPTLFTWNDMNEPSVFNGPELTMPKSCAHHGGWTHGDVHNQYGQWVHSATFDGHRLRAANARPFVLSRSFFAGSHRFGAVWTGDNLADWAHLRMAVPMLLSLSVAGLPLVGADVGGFFKDPSPELMARWYEVAAYTPFFRNHAHQDTARRELFVFEPQHADRMRRAILARYALLPYIYSEYALRTAALGEPLMRPIWWDFAADARLLANEEAFMVGRALLVQGIYEEGHAAAEVTLPEGALWFDRRDGAPVEGHSLPVHVSGFAHEEGGGVPVFQRGGTVVAERRRVRKSTEAMATDPFTLVVAPSAELVATGELYVDDGHSVDYATHSLFLHSRFSLDHCVLSCAVEHGLFRSARVERLVLLGAHSAEWHAEVWDGAHWVHCLDSASVRPASAHSVHVKLPLRCAAVSFDAHSDWKLRFHNREWCGGDDHAG